MSTCPFCNGAIDDALALHGGTCPRCLAEIPGEETATDPGEEVKALQAAEDQARARRRALLPLLVATPFALALVAFAAWSLRPAPEVEALVLGADEFSFEIDLASYVPPPEPVDEAPQAAAHERAARPRTAGAVPTPRPSADELARRLADAGGSGEAPARRGRSGAVTPPEPGIRDIGGPTASQAGGSADLDVSFQARRTAALLTSRDDIQAAVHDMLRARSPRLQQCFERSLKGREDLAGQWRLSFTIGEDGALTGPSAQGVQMSDQGFEDCLVREMASWRIYGRLARPWPVSLPIAFRNDG